MSKEFSLILDGFEDYALITHNEDIKIKTITHIDLSFVTQLQENIFIN